MYFGPKLTNFETTWTITGHFQTTKTTYNLCPIIYASLEFCVAHTHFDNYSVSVIAFVLAFIRSEILTTVNSTYAMQEAVDQGFQINFYFKNTRVFERGLHQTY